MLNRENDPNVKGFYKKGYNEMWTVVYMTQDRDNAMQIRNAVESGKIITKIRALKKSEENYCYEILVPASEVEEAHSLILETEL